MKYYPSNRWTLSGIMDSADKNYKYTAILINNDTSLLDYVCFGKSTEQHFFDSTGLNSYSHLNNNNIVIKNDYINRNRNKIMVGHLNQTLYELKYLYDYCVE